MSIRFTSLFTKQQKGGSCETQAGTVKGIISSKLNRKGLPIRDTDPLVSFTTSHSLLSPINAERTTAKKILDVDPYNAFI